MFWSSAHENLPIHLFTVMSPALIVLPRFFGVRTVTKDQKWEINRLRDVEPYPVGESCRGPSGPPEFRRFLDLRIEFSVSRMMAV